MRSRPQTLFAALVALLVSALLSGDARARDRGLHVVELDDLQAAFDFLVGIDIERLEILDQALRINRRAEKIFLGQRLGAFGEGSFVHPKLWYWRAMVDVLFIEDIFGGDLAGTSTLFQTPSLETERFAVEPEFDIQFNFLQGKPYPITVFANRKTHLVRREFMSNYWLNTFTTGGSVGWNNTTFPFSAQYTYLLNDGDERELSSGAEQHQVYASGSHESADFRTSLEYRMSDYKNRLFSEGDYAFHYGYYTANYDIDDDKDYKLNVWLRAQHRDFTILEQDEARLSGMFIAKLLDPLRLRVETDLAWWRWSDINGLQTGGWVELQHQLFESVTTTALARVAYDWGEDTNRVQETVSGSVTYRKDMGPLLMTHGYVVSGIWTQFGASPALARVIDEPVSLEGEIPTRLAWPGVNPASLEVLDSTRSIRYNRELDYRITQEGDVTYMQRLTGGDIPDGATVLVSYDYQAAAVAQSNQVNQQYFARLETDLWKYLRVYGQYSLRDDNRYVAGVPDFSLTYHEAAAGVDAGTEGARANAEYRYVTSEHYTAHQASVGTSYFIPFSRSFKPMLGVRELYLDIDLTDERKNLLEFFSEALFPIYGPLTGEWHVSYQWEDGGANDGQFMTGKTKISWPIRQVLLWLEYGVVLERKERQNYDRHSITFNVRRMF